MDILNNKSIRMGIIIFLVVVTLMAILTFAFKNMNVNKLPPTIKKMFKWHPTYSDKTPEVKKVSKKQNQQKQQKQQQLLEDEKKQLDEEWDNIEKEKRELETRESLLVQKQSELEDLERELGVLQDKLEAKLQNTKELAQYYELMETRNAAQILENTDDDFIIQLITHMKKETASEILSNLDPKKAASITKKMSGI